MSILSSPFKQTYQLITLFLLLLLSISCEKENMENAVPEVNPVQSSFSGGRGTVVQISINIISEAGIKSVAVTSTPYGTETLPVDQGVKSTSVNFPFPIPLGATLGEDFTVTFSVTDINEQKTEREVAVTTSALIELPENYIFLRNQISSVDFSGQTERLQMVAAIKSYLGKGDNGEKISAQILENAFANEGGNGNGFFDFSSTKQLKDKTFPPDLDQHFFESLFTAAESASQNGSDQITASEGTAGLLVRENSQRTILVDEHGREFTQLIEKGLMGSVMLHQIFNTYLTDGRIGDQVENNLVSDGKNYTAREHHWDEAFGYFSAPDDFSSNWPSERRSDLKYWSNYSNVADPFLATNDIIMDAFIQGRTAIVNNDQPGIHEARNDLYDQLELVAAAVAIHYINSTLTSFSQGFTGEAFHTLSEAWSFTRALIYSPRRKISLDLIDQILYQDFGTEGNFWKATPSGLLNAKSKIIQAYPSLQNVQDDL